MTAGPNMPSELAACLVIKDWDATGSLTCFAGSLIANHDQADLARAGLREIFLC